MTCGRSPGEDGRLLREREHYECLAAPGYRSLEERFYATGAFAEVQANMKERLGGVEEAIALEIGCGAGEQSVELAALGARVVGVDVSEKRIAAAKRLAAELKRAEKVTFGVAEAEALPFPDAAFDLVVGYGVLHHLDLKRALPEISRVLAKGGRAIFMEPLGHNPALNLYRKLTPRARTKDEAPLRIEEIRLLGKHFRKVTWDAFFLFSLAAFAFRTLIKSEALFTLSLRALNPLDAFVTQRFPFCRRYCWIANIFLEK